MDANAWTNMFLDKETESGPTLPKPHDVIVITNSKGKAIGEEDLTAGMSIATPPKPLDNVVGSIQITQKKTTYTPKKPLHGSSETQGTAAVLQSYGFSRSTAQRVASRQTGVSHHTVHARSAQATDVINRMVSFAKGTKPNFKPQPSRPSAKILQAGGMTTKEGVLWTPNGKDVYITPISHEKDVVNFQNDSHYFQEITIKDPGFPAPKVKPPKGYTGPVLKAAPRRKGLAAVFQRAKSGYYGDLVSDAAWGADAFGKMFKAEVKQDVKTGKRIAGVPGGIVGALVGVGLGATHVGGAVYYGIHHTQYAHSGITTGKQMLNNKDLMLSDFVATAPLTTISAADALPATATGAAKHDVTVVVPDAVQEGDDIFGRMRVRTVTGLGRRKTFNYTFEGTKIYGKQAKIDLLGKKRLSVGVRESMDAFSFKLPDTLSPKGWAKVRQIEKFVGSENKRISWGKAWVEKPKRTFSMDFKEFSATKKGTTLSKMVGTTSDDYRVLGLSRVRNPKSARLFADESVVSKKGFRMPGVKKSRPFVVEGTEGKGSSVMKTLRKIKRADQPKQPRTTARSISRLITQGAEKGLTATRTEAVLVRAIAGTAAVATVAKMVASTELKTRSRVRALSKTVAVPAITKSVMKTKSISRAIEKFIGTTKTTTATRTATATSTVTRTATPVEPVTVGTTPKTPPKIPPFFSPVKLGSGGGGIRGLFGRRKSARYGLRIHKIADLETFMFGKKGGKKSI